MTYQECARRMRKIERELMILANDSNGNSREFDAILKAQSALYEYRKSL